MATIDTPGGGDNVIKSRLEGLTDEQNDNLLKILEGLTGEQKDRLSEMLQEDKKLREERNSSESEKLINSVSEYFDKISGEIKTMKENVDKIQYGYNIYYNKRSFERILNEFNKMVDRFKSLIDKWCNNKITVSDIRADIQQDMIKMQLAKYGRITWMMRFLSYTRIPNLKDQMEEHGIDVSLLESICSDTTKMLNELNIEIIVPTVLMDDYDINLHDYENDDMFLDSFFPINIFEYKNKVLDILKVGYEIKDEKGNIIESRKPLTKYII